MSKRSARAAALGDDLALRVQELRSRDKSASDPPLLRIDHRNEAARAPYQFDSVRGRLHRRGCRSIPKSSRSALYGVWEMRAEEKGLACPQCKPVPNEGKAVDETLATDLFYGFVSILDQFRGVLRERGREYRKSRKGKHLRLDIEGLYASFGQQEKQTLDVVASALDGIVTKIKDFDQTLSRGNGGNGRPRQK